MTKFIAVIALLTVTGCSALTARDNAHFDYRMNSFQTVNHCLHSTQMGC